MNLFRRTTASIALVALVSGVFSTGVSAYDASELMAANALAAKGFINTQNDAAGYNLDATITRAEMAKVAANIAGIDANSTCENKFADVSATTPNTWVCGYAEALLANGLVSANANFNPNANISKSEAVKLMLTAAGETVSYTDATWQADFVAHAIENGFVASFSDYNTSADRGFVFGTASAATTEEEGDILSELEELLNTDGNNEEETTTETETPVVMNGDDVLEVTLSSSTPNAQNIPSTAKNVEFLAFDVTAGSEDATIDTIVLQRVDLGARTNFDKVWISKDGVVVTNDKSINSSDLVTISTSLEIKAGSTETFTVNASMNGVVSVVNAFELVSLESSTNVVLDDVRGNSMTTVAYAVAQITLTPKGSASTVDAGEEMEVIGEFKLAETETTSKKDAILKSIRFKTTGGVDIEDNLENIALYDGSTMVSTETVIDGDYVTFKLADLVIEDAKSQTFTIKADIISGDDADTIAFDVKDDFDIYAIEEGTSIGASIVKGATLATYTLNAGKTTISRSTSNPSSEEFVSDSDDVLAFIAKVDTDQTVLIDSLKLFVTNDSVVFDAVPASVTTNTELNKQIENVRVYVNETLVDSVDTITVVNADVLDGASYYDFDSSFELNDDDQIKVLFDLTVDAGAGTKIKFSLDNVGTAAGISASLLDVEYVSDGETVAQAKLTGSATSNFVEVVAAGAGSSIVRNDGFSSETYLAGEQSTELMKFVVNAGNSSSLEIRKLNFDFTTAGTFVSSDLTNVKLLKDGSQVGGTEDVNSSSVTIDDIDVIIAKGAQATFTLVADIDTSATTDSLTATLDVTDSIFYDVNDNEITSFSDVAGDASTVGSNAILAASIDGDTAESAIVLANTNGVEVAKYKFTATDGDINIKDLYFANVTTGADSRVSALKLLVNGSVVDSRVPSSDVIHFDLGSSNQIVVPKNDDIVITIEADFNKISDASQTNKIITLELTDIVADTAATSKELTLANGVAIDDGNHYTTSALSATDIQGEAMTIRKTQPTIATQSVGTTKLSAGEQTVYKVSISADSAEDVEIGAITFDVTDGTTNGIGGYKLFINGTEKDASEYTLAGTAFSFDYNETETISAGTSKTFELKLTPTGALVDNDYVTVKITEDTTTIVAGTLDADEDDTFDNATDVRTLHAGAKIIWSDNAGSPHDATTADWFNGVNVNGLDTISTTLEK